MSHRNINLHLFTIDKWAIDLLPFFDLDSDYTEDGDDSNWEYSGEDDEHGDPISLAIKLGFKTESERLLAEWDDQEADDHTRIGNILDKIDEFCHGSYSSQFTYEIEEIEDGYSVAIAYLT
tara:strand:- start:410 stop:772 length:363 start_codon:yes stop_codon:yes gene_type:complete